MYEREKKINEKYDDFLNVRFLLASQMRPKLLLLLLNSDQDLNSFREELDKPSASILHGLKELEGVRLISKNFKYYSLSSKGFLYSLSLDKLSKDLFIFQENREFWQSHSIDSLPLDSFRNAYLLKDSILVESDETDLSKTLIEYLDLLSNSEDMRIILPIFSEQHLDIILENLENGGQLQLITTEEVLYSLRKSGYFKSFAEYSKNNQIDLRKLNIDIELFLTICENAMSLSLFFNDGLFDDSSFILNQTEDGIKWANMLFSYYLKMSVRVIL